jgi:hypothetical protein
MKRRGKSMFNEYVTRVAECEQKAKTARNQNDKHSWLAMADSWRKTAELQLILERQAQFIHEHSVPRASRVWSRPLTQSAPISS